MNSNYNILFLQPKCYFDELGVEYSGINATFGIVFVLNVFSELSKYDMVVSCVDHDSHAREIILKAKSVGTKTVFIMDGIYEENNAKNNPITKRKGLELLVPVIYDHVVTLTVKHSEYLEKQDVSASLYVPKRAAINIIPNKESNKILLTTALTPYFNSVQKEKALKFYKDIISYFELSDLDVLYRVFDKDIASLLPKGLNDINTSLDEQVSSSKLIVSTPSTVLFSAHAKGIETITLNYRNDRIFYDSSFNVSTINEFKVIINSLTLDSIKRCSENDIIYGLKLSELYESINENEVKKKYFENEIYISFSYLYRCVYRSVKKLNLRIVNDILKKIRKEYG